MTFKFLWYPKFFLNEKNMFGQKVHIVTTQAFEIKVYVSKMKLPEPGSKE